MNKKKYITEARNVINLEIKALQTLKKILIILLMKQLFKLQNANQKLFYVELVKVVLLPQK